MAEGKEVKQTLKKPPDGTRTRTGKKETGGSISSREVSTKQRMGEFNDKEKSPLLEWVRIVLDNNEEAISLVESRQDWITKAFKEILSGYKTNPAGVLKKVAETGSFQGFVCEAGIKFMSMCRHHFLPFFGTANIVYEPGKHIIGLGKISRLVQVFAKRLQFQEKLSNEIANEFMQSGGAKGVFVETRARHLCMGHRGPNDPGAVAVVTVALGTLKGYEAEQRARELIAHSLTNEK